MNQNKCIYILLPHVKLEDTCHKMTIAVYKLELSIFGFPTTALQHHTNPSHGGTLSCKKSQVLLEIQLGGLHSPVCIHQVFKSQHINKTEFRFLCLYVFCAYDCLHCRQWCSNTQGKESTRSDLATTAQSCSPPNISKDVLLGWIW